MRHLPRPDDPAVGPARSGTPELMAAEVRRMADKGCHAVTFSENPEKLGLAQLAQRPLGPVPARRARRRAPSSASTSARRRRRSITAMDAPIDTMITLQPMNIVQCAADLVWSPVFRKFPNLRDRAVRGRHRLGAVLPRADRLRVPAPPRVDEPGLRRQAPEPGVQRERPHLLHRRRRRHGGPPPPQHRPHPLGVRLPALRLHVAATRRRWR